MSELMRRLKRPKPEDDACEGSFGPKVALKLGPYGTHNSEVFPLTNITIKSTIEEKADPARLEAEVVITYTFANTYREAELWYPYGELDGIMTFSLSVNGEDVQGRKLQEFAPGGVPPRIRLPPQGVPQGLSSMERDPPKPQHVKYHYWRGEQLEDLEPDTTTTLTVEYSFLLPPVGVGVHSWILPLSLIPIVPAALSLHLKLTKDIVSVTSINLPAGLRIKREGGTAQVTLDRPELLDINQHYLVIKISTHKEPWDPFYPALVAFLLVCVLWIGGLLYLIFHPDVLLGMRGR